MVVVMVVEVRAVAVNKLHHRQRTVQMREAGCEMCWQLKDKCE